MRDALVCLLGRSVVRWAYLSIECVPKMAATVVAARLSVSNVATQTHVASLVTVVTPVVGVPTGITELGRGRIEWEFACLS